MQEFNTVRKRETPAVDVPEDYFPFWQKCQAAPPANRQRMLNALHCLPVDRPPLWLMRQAGRCLPEYRALRKKHSFQELIQQPELAAEVTLQPIVRFDFDAAILFSDILVVPQALGQGFRFRETAGVEMDFVLRDNNDIAKLQSEGMTDRLQYVADAIQLIKASLQNRTALFGFAGSPWTLANFMLEGGSSQKHSKALELFRSNRESYFLLAEKLCCAVIEFLKLQIAAGVDAIQIFDSVGGLLPDEEFEEASGQWLRTIVSALREQVPIIVYSKGTRNWDALVRTGAPALGIDHEIELSKAVSCLPASVAVQGNFNPELLSASEPRLVEGEARRLLNQMRRRNGYIFNLGHGVPPDAKMENLETLVETVRNFA
jgi:uroporphyrinogen decarboxylase